MTTAAEIVETESGIVAGAVAHGAGLSPEIIVTRSVHRAFRAGRQTQRTESGPANTADLATFLGIEIDTSRPERVPGVSGVLFGPQTPEPAFSELGLPKQLLQDISMLPVRIIPESATCPLADWLVHNTASIVRSNTEAQLGDVWCSLLERMQDEDKHFPTNAHPVEIGVIHSLVIAAQCTAQAFYNDQITGGVEAMK